MLISTYARTFLMFLLLSCAVLTTNTRCYFDCRYVRLLGATYMRLTGTSVDCYKYLEPLYNDYRKVKMQKRDGGISTLTVNLVIATPGYA